jgi:uncharacterized protein YrzB (UPF0473 family)
MQDNIVNLIDEQGNEIQFEIILTLEAEGKEYAILMPLEDNEDEEALIFNLLTARLSRAVFLIYILLDKILYII